MSDIRGTAARSRRADQLIDEVSNSPRVLSADEAQLVCIQAYKYRHLAAYLDDRQIDGAPPRYVRREAAMRPDAPCPACHRNLHVSVPDDAAAGNTPC